MAGYWWTGSLVSPEAHKRDRDLWWTPKGIGVSLGRKADGSWREFATIGWGDEYVFVLQGGRRQRVPAAYYPELVTAGYGPYIEVQGGYIDTYVDTMED